MKCRPILFSAAMVRAILEGRKTQTRRSVRLHEALAESLTAKSFAYLSVDGGWVIDNGAGMFQDRLVHAHPGDRLWVREEHYRFGHWEKVTGIKKRTRTGRQRWKFVADYSQVLFDPPAEFRRGMHHKDPGTPAWHKRLARFMPRDFSRITLEIESIRVERLNDISEADAMAEGADRLTVLATGKHGTLLQNESAQSTTVSIGLPKYPACRGNENAGSYRVGFWDIWTRINGPGSWDANPWVWVITFKRIEGEKR